MLAKSESPNATMRVSGFFGASPALPVRRSRRRVASPAPTRRRQRHRALLVALVHLRRLAAGQALDVRFGPAAAAGLDDLLRGVAVGAAFDRRHRSRQRVGRQQLEVLGDRMRRIAGRDRHGLVGADQRPMPLTSSDDVVAGVDAPVLQQRLQAAGCGWSAFSTGSSMSSSLPPLREIRLEQRRSPAPGSRSSGPAMTRTSASAGTSLCCASTILSTTKLSEVSAAAMPL